MAALIKSYLLMAIAAALLLPSVLTAQEKCEGRARIIKTADVYKQAPKYVTGSGWQGDVATTLNRNTQVYLCREQSVQFGFSTKQWVQIAYESPKGKWRYGWVLNENLILLSGMKRKIDTKSGYTLIRVAFAGEPMPNSENSEWKLGPAPPVPASQDEAKSVSTIQEPGSATLSDLGELYWPLFVAMLLGMIAKAGVDLVNVSSKSMLKEHLKNGVVAILVSPIVFLGFLNAGQFPASSQTFIVLWLLAFQNGFFWQTVLKRPVRS